MKSGKKYKILFSKTASKDKIKLKNSGLDKTCQKILNAMIINPFCYPPSYEKLTGELTGYYSRRINRQHRIVYKIIEDKKHILCYRRYDNFSFNYWL